MCKTHMSSKNEVEWYLQKFKKRKNSYDTINQLIKRQHVYLRISEFRYKLRRHQQLRNQHKTQETVQALRESAMSTAWRKALIWETRTWKEGSDSLRAKENENNTRKVWQYNTKYTNCDQQWLYAKTACVKD